MTSYEITLIENETDARLCAQLLAQEFSTSNPMIVFRKRTSQQLFETFFWPMVTEVLDEKLSFLVRYRPTNEIVATMIANDLFPYCQKYPGPTSVNPVADVHTELRNQFVQHDLPRPLEPNMVIFLSAGATSSEHAGKGIGARLRAHICRYARDNRGFQYGFAQTSNPATRRIYSTKLNAKETAVVHLKTWLWKRADHDDSYPFQDYDGEPIANFFIELK